MKTKIQIKTGFGTLLFELEKENNSIKETIIEAVKQGAYLQGADLQEAYLQGADLQEAYLQGADLRGAYLQEAYLRGAYLQGADLQGAYLQGADLRGAYLRGADLRRVKIKKAIVFTGLYKYAVIPYITESDEKRIKMGCFDRTVEEWEKDFWNNTNEFPNDGNEASQLRLFAFETAKKWFEIVK